MLRIAGVLAERPRVQTRPEIGVEPEARQHGGDELGVVCAEGDRSQMVEVRDGRGGRISGESLRLHARTGGQPRRVEFELSGDRPVRGLRPERLLVR